MLERRARRLAVVLEHQDVLEARVLLEIDHPLAVGEQHVGHRVGRQRGQRGLVIGRLDHDLVGAHAVHPVVESLAASAPDRPRCGARGTCWRRPGRTSPGSFGRRVGRAAGEDLGRGLVLVAADRTRSCRPRGRTGSVLEVRRPARALGGDDHPAPDDRILPQLRHGVPHPRVLPRRRPSQQRRQRLGRRLAVEEHRRHLRRDRQRHAVPRGQRQRRAHRRHALGDHARGLPRALARLSPARQRHAERAVARERARWHVSTRSPRPARPASVAGLAAERDGQPRDLGEPARDQRRARVLAQPEAVGQAGGHRDHVLERAADLDADHVAVRVEPELARAERAAAARRPSASSRRRRSPPRWAGPARPRARTSAPTAPPPRAPGQRSRDHLGHARGGAPARSPWSPTRRAPPARRPSRSSVSPKNSDGTAHDHERGRAAPPPRRPWRRCPAGRSTSDRYHGFRRARPDRLDDLGLARPQPHRRRRCARGGSASAVPQLPRPDDARSWRSSQRSRGCASRPQPRRSVPARRRAMFSRWRTDDDRPRTREGGERPTRQRIAEQERARAARRAPPAASRARRSGTTSDDHEPHDEPRRNVASGTSRSSAPRPGRHALAAAEARGRRTSSCRRPPPPRRPPRRGGSPPPAPPERRPPGSP